MAKRRRYWLWLAWSGVFALVSFCVLAVWTRPRPFRFVEGGKVYEAYVTDSRTLPRRLSAVTRYDIATSLESVEIAAQKELPASEGWVWQHLYSQHVARRASTKEMVVISQSISYASGERELGPIVVFHHRRASFLDRIQLQKR
jgi:hypothetical protein